MGNCFAFLQCYGYSQLMRHSHLCDTPHQKKSPSLITPELTVAIENNNQEETGQDRGRNQEMARNQGGSPLDFWPFLGCGPDLDRFLLDYYFLYRLLAPVELGKGISSGAVYHTKDYGI
ncbi:hypothetical protein EV1_021431 [Malus domestica]